MVLAVSTLDGVVEIVDVTTKFVAKVVSPCSAGLPRRRVKEGELIRLALDHKTAAEIVSLEPARCCMGLGLLEFSRHHRCEGPGEWVQGIQPSSPKRPHCRVWDLHTTECAEDKPEEGIEENSNLNTRRECCHQLAKRYPE